MGEWLHTQRRQKTAGVLLPQRAEKLGLLVEQGKFSWSLQYVSGSAYVEKGPNGGSGVGSGLDLGSEGVGAKEEDGSQGNGVGAETQVGEWKEEGRRRVEGRKGGRDATDHFIFYCVLTASYILLHHFTTLTKSHLKHYL